MINDYEKIQQIVEATVKEFVQQIRHPQYEAKEDSSKGIVVTLTEKYPIRLTQDDHLEIYEKNDTTFHRHPKIVIKLKKMDVQNLTNILRNVK